MNESACNFQVVPTTSNVIYPIGGSVIQSTRFPNESKFSNVGRAGVLEMATGVNFLFIGS
jgi:hypothetical protein